MFWRVKGTRASVPTRGVSRVESNRRVRVCSDLTVVVVTGTRMMFSSPADTLVSGCVESIFRLLPEVVSSDGVGLSTPARGHVSAGVGGLESARRF